MNTNTIEYLPTTDRKWAGAIPRSSEYVLLHADFIAILINIYDSILCPDHELHMARAGRKW